MRIFIVVTLSCLGFGLLNACQTPPQSHPHGAAIHFTILHTNDHHGRFWANGDGEYGMAARKTLIDNIRAEVEAAGGYSLLLSGGDINTGVPESDTLDAEPDFKGMKHLGYDAMAVGNHEFDNSVATIRQQESWAEFPFLAANIYDANKQRLFAPYHLFKFDGITIGVIGLITHETAFIGNREFIKGLTFTLPEVETETLLPQVKSQSDVVIALTHMGHTPSGLGSDVSLAGAVPGLDMIIGGHSAQALCVDQSGRVLDTYQPGAPCVPDNINGTWIMQAEEWGRYLGRADFTFANGELTLDAYRLIPVNLRDTHGNLVGEAIEQDAETLALLRPFQESGVEALSQVIGRTSGAFERDVIPYLPHTSPLGNLIADAMIAATGADIAVINSGGIRAGFKAGEITVRDILTMQPFNNSIYLQTFSGLELTDYLRNSKLLDNNPKELQYSGIYLDSEGHLRVTNTQAPIDPKQTYVLAINNFMAHGGDGYPVLAGNPRLIDTGMLDYQVLLDYIQVHSPLSP